MKTSKNAVEQRSCQKSCIPLLKETSADLAGEMSGHVFFADRFFGFDDAIYAGARLLEILSKSGRKPSEFLTDLAEVINTSEIRVECSDDLKFKIVRHLTREFKKLIR